MAHHIVFGVERVLGNVVRNGGGRDRVRSGLRNDAFLRLCAGQGRLKAQDLGVESLGREDRLDLTIGGEGWALRIKARAFGLGGAGG